MNENIRKAYSEVDAILTLLGSEWIEKISSKFLTFIKTEKDPNYVANIKPDIYLEEQNLLPETISILAMLKLDYWCETEEEKEELLNMLNENERAYQEELSKKYSVESLFKNRDQTKSEENKGIIEYKESNFFAKICEKIRKFFYK